MSRSDDDLLQSVRAARRGPAWRAWFRERSTPVRRLLVGLAVLTVAGVNLALFRRADWASYPGLRMGIAVLSFLVLAALLVFAAVVRPAESADGPGPIRSAILVTSLAVPFCLAALPPARDATGAAIGAAASFWAAAGGCLLWGALMGLPTLVLLAAMDRAPSFSRATILLCIALAGLAGNLALQLHCPIVDPAHLIVGHALLPAAFALATLPLLLRAR